MCMFKTQNTLMTFLKAISWIVVCVYKSGIFQIQQISEKLQCPTFKRLTGVSKSLSFLNFRSWRYTEKFDSVIGGLFIDICTPTLPKAQNNYFTTFHIIIRIQTYIFLPLWYSQQSWPQNSLFLQKWLHSLLPGSDWAGSEVSRDENTGVVQFNL